MHIRACAFKYHTIARHTAWGSLLRVQDMIANMPDEEAREKAMTVSEQLVLQHIVNREGKQGGLDTGMRRKIGLNQMRLMLVRRMTGENLWTVLKDELY